MNCEKIIDKRNKKYVVTILVAIIGGLFSIFIQIIKSENNLAIEKMREEHEILIRNTQNEYKQIFYSEITNVEKVGVKYNQYYITSEPKVPGYHVYILPYSTSIDPNGNESYSFADNMFTQDEYVSDMNGCCKLLKEVEDEYYINASYIENKSETDYLIAIKYVENNEDKIETFNLSSGQMIEPDESKTIDIINLYQ